METNAAILDTRPHLLGMTPEDLQTFLQNKGTTCSLPEARRLLAHVISDGALDIEPKRHPVSRALRSEVETHTRRSRLKIVERTTDPDDGFQKYLIELEDGNTVEAVQIPLHKENHFTVCLSSQVGCAMQCAFCATGRLGLTRNLDAWEIVACFMAVRDEVRDSFGSVGGRVSGAVFMGQGEPLHNYDAVVQAAKVLSHPCGGRIAAEAISISTVGLVPQIRRYTDEGHPYRLIVSLTSAIAEKRSRLLPIAGKFSIEDVANAIRAHAEKIGDRMTVAWVLMGGVNDGHDEAEALQHLLQGVSLRVNIIDVNDARPDGFRRATDEERSQFIDALQILRMPIVRRYSGGRSRHAACGMLAATRWEGAPPESRESPQAQPD